jgi:ABC-type transporter Mla MlaB component
MKIYLILGILVGLIIALMLIIRRRREHFTGNSCIITKFGNVTADKNGKLLARNSKFKKGLSASDITDYKAVMCLDVQLANNNTSLFALPELTTNIGDDLSKLQGSDIDAICSNEAYKLDCSKIKNLDTARVASFLSNFAHQLKPSDRPQMIINAPTNSECGPIKTNNNYC